MNDRNDNEKYIFDYINANELPCDVESLENDPLFMADVIRLTRDKKMYRLCSEDVKNDYDFVKFLISMFRTDTLFIMEIVDNYIKNNNNFLEEMELNILMSNIFDETKDSELEQYKFNAYCSYMSLMFNFEQLSVEYEDLGKGFYLFSKITQSKVILDYIARIMIGEIFYDTYSNNIEELLHINFSDFSELEKRGVTNFLLSYIDSLDPFLSNYISRNLWLLKEYDKKISYIKKNWHNYINRVNREKIDMVYDEMYNYASNNMPLSIMDYQEILKNIITKLGLLDIFERYDNNFNPNHREDTSFDNNLGKTEPSLYLDNKSSIYEKKYIAHMTWYIQELFRYSVIVDPYDMEKEEETTFEKNKEKNKQCTIIEYDFKAKKVLKKYSVKKKKYQ